MLRIPSDTETQNHGHRAFWVAVTELTLGVNRELPFAQVLGSSTHVSFSVPFNFLTPESEKWFNEFCEGCSSIWEVRETNLDKTWEYRMSLTDASVDYDLRPEQVPEWIWEFCSRIFMARQDGELLYVACATVHVPRAAEDEREEDVIRVLSNNGSEVISTGWTTEECRQYVGRRIPLPSSRYEFRPKLVHEHDEELGVYGEDFPEFNMWTLPTSDLRHLYSNSKADL